MRLVEIIGELRRSRLKVGSAEKKIVQRALQHGIRNKNIDSVFDLTDHMWKAKGCKLSVDWNGKGEFEELDLIVTEYVNDGPVFMFSVWDCNLSGNIGEDALVLLNGKKLVGLLDVSNRVNAGACA